MITITVTTSKEFAFAEAAMGRELMVNPNLNGADFVVEYGDYCTINGGDAIVCAALMCVVYAQESESESESES